MKLDLNEYYLITTSEFFLAPDGRQYRAAFGEVTAVQSAEETLGIKTNAKSTNWYVTIGNMVIAGCQIQYVVKTEHYYPGKALSFQSDAANGVREFEIPCVIYNASKAFNPPTFAERFEAPVPETVTFELMPEKELAVGEFAFNPVDCSVQRVDIDGLNDFSQKRLVPAKLLKL